MVPFCVISFLLLATAFVSHGVNFFKGTKLLNSGIELSISINLSTDVVEIIIIGDSTKYFAVGFGGATMEGRYAIIASGINTISDHALKKDDSDQSTSILDPSPITVLSDNVFGSSRTIIVSRPRLHSSYNFPATGTAILISVISAFGSSTTIGYHGPSNRYADSITLDFMMTPDSPATIVNCTLEDETCPDCTCFDDCVHDRGVDESFKIIRNVGSTRDCCKICKKDKNCLSWMYLTSDLVDCFVENDCFLYDTKFEDCDNGGTGGDGGCVSGSINDKKCESDLDCCEPYECDLSKGKGKCKKPKKTKGSSGSFADDQIFDINDNINNENNDIKDLKVSLSLSTNTTIYIAVLCFILLIIIITRFYSIFYSNRSSK